jgi:hypothetical protein
MPAGSPAEDVIASNVQLVGLTRRAAVMESQVDSLEGKRRALVRFRDETTGELLRRTGGRSARSPEDLSPPAS